MKAKDEMNKGVTGLGGIDQVLSRRIQKMGPESASDLTERRPLGGEQMLHPQPPPVNTWIRPSSGQIGREVDASDS